MIHARALEMISTVCRTGTPRVIRMAAPTPPCVADSTSRLTRVEHDMHQHRQIPSRYGLAIMSDRSALTGPGPGILATLRVILAYVLTMREPAGAGAVSALLARRDRLERASDLRTGPSNEHLQHGD